MTTVEVSGKSVEEATKIAAGKLGVDPGSVKVTVIDETKGLFGKSTVRVRAEAIGQEVAPVSEAAPAAEAVVHVEETPVAEEAPVAKPARPSRRKEKPVEPMEQITEAMSEAPAVEAAEEETVARGDVVATDADANQLRDLVESLLASADLDVTAKIKQVSGRYVTLEMDGKDAAYLVGKHGEVINAMQYLVNIIASRKFNNGVRATLDGNDYRHRREEALTAHAVSIAKVVLQRGEEAVLDALPAFERRIIHKALSEYEGVQTYSEGEEPNRRVVIAPND